MDEKISIEFSAVEFDQIFAYMKLVDAKTVQEAIAFAIEESVSRYAKSQ